MTFDINNNQCIRFTDTNGITYNMWTKFLNVINHLGYAIPDENTLKEYFDRHTYLQPDQSKAILCVLGLEHQPSLYTKKQIETDNQKAKDYFGVTDDFKIAGYLLIDGSMLNFSYDGLTRTQDHREIKEILNMKTDGYNDPLIQFVNYGNIRLMNRGFELCKIPSDAQIKQISKLIRQMPEIYIDISNTEGHVVKSFEYQFATPSQVISDIKNYFDSIAIKEN